MNFASVTACIVTRGNVNLTPILSSLPFEEIVIWDNSKREDLSVYGRYAAIAEAKTPLIYVQDDDVLLSRETIEEICWMSDSGTDAYGCLTCNMPEHWRADYPDSALVGFGAVFHRDLPLQAFKRLRRVVRRDESFLRTCDVAFTTLTPYVLVDLPMTILDYAYGDDRMCRQPGFKNERKRMHDLAIERLVPA